MNTIPMTRMCLDTLSVCEGRVLTEKGTTFDAISYSKFKYGDGSIAHSYGERLAEAFIAGNPELFDASGSQINLVVTTSPYKYIPKGSSGIVEGFVDHMNRHLLSIGKMAISSIQIFKESMFEGDYGTFSERERSELNEKNKLHIFDSYITGKEIIVIDDLRITGSHERNVFGFLQGKGIKKAHFLYVAAMDQSYARAHPQIESELNHAWVKGFSQIAEIIDAGNFILNARICKYALSHPDKSERIAFFRSRSLDFLAILRAAVIGDGYASMPSYSDAFRDLEAEMARKSP